MSVDLSKIKPGDEVLVRAEFVRLNSFGNPEVRVHGPSDTSVGHVKPCAIVSHTPRALAVGDEAYYRQYLGTIKAIDGKLAWLKADNVPHEGHIAPLSELRRTDV